MIIRDEYFPLANQLVDYLEQWPTLTSEQKEHAAKIQAVLQAYDTRQEPHFYSQFTPDGRYDMRHFDLSCRTRILDRNPATANHIEQARAELAMLVQHRQD